MPGGHHIQRLMFVSIRTCHISQRVSANLPYFKNTSLSSVNTLGCVTPRAFHLSHSLCKADKGDSKVQDDLRKPSGYQTSTSASQQIKSFSVLKYIKKSLPLSLKLDVPIGKFSTGSGTEMSKNLGFAAHQRQAQASFEIKLTAVFTCGLFFGLLIYLYNGRNRAREKLIMALAVDGNMMPVLNTQLTDGTGLTPQPTNIAGIANAVLPSGENISFQSHDDDETTKECQEACHVEDLSNADHDAIENADVPTSKNQESEKKIERPKKKPNLFLIDKYKISTISKKNQENY